MKFKWDKKYLYWGTTALVVLLIAILFNFVLQNNYAFRTAFKSAIKISAPIIDGIIIAFLIDSLVKWFEKKFFPIFNRKIYDYRNLSERGQKIVRTLSIVLSYIVLVLLTAGFVLAIIPQISESIKEIKVQFPAYKTNFELWLNRISTRYPEIRKISNTLVDNYSEEFENWQNTVLIPWLQNSAASLSLYIINAFSAIWNIIIGFIVSIYILMKKETFKGQFKKITYALLNIKNGNIVIKNTRMALNKFSGFIIGKILDSIIIGLICFIVCRIVGIEYDILLAMIIGVTNIIPFFGPFIGAIPSTILLLLINPIHALYFVIFIIVLQILDGNVIGPKILGSSTGISSFWVIFAITIFGGLWGVAGMIIGVPLFAVIYTIIKSILDINLKNKELTNKTEDYIYLDYIDVETKQLVETEVVIPEKKVRRKDKKSKSEDKNGDK